MYSQGQEEKFIVEFFNGKHGTLLDIGANDGETFSNSLRLIELGWKGYLIEPSQTCIEKLNLLHKENNKIIILKMAIGNETKEMLFHESGALPLPEIGGVENISLVSTLVEDEKKRWESLNMHWNKYPVQVYSWNDFLNGIPNKKFDFISIDAEGVDIDILEQINLSLLETKLICVEWNLNESIKQRILNHTSKFGLDKVIYQSGENLLISKN